jgi:ribosomal protein S18 acetylase RimI-like enzyme
MERGEDKPKISMLRAGVQVNNPGAIRFWQRMGFAITSAAELLPDGTTCYRLEKHL